MAGFLGTIFLYKNNKMTDKNNSNLEQELEAEKLENANNAKPFEADKEETKTSEFDNDVESTDNETTNIEIDGGNESGSGQLKGIFAKLKNNKKEKKKSKLEQTEAELAEQKDKNLRIFAEFDNFKKRTAKERLELFKTAGKDLVIDLLSVLDDFDRATKAADEARANDKPVDLDGFNLIHNKIKSVLGNKGLKEMETNGEVFDAELHAAITEIQAPNEDLKGKIVDTVEKGYYMSDVIIRHAKVVVGK